MYQGTNVPDIYLRNENNPTLSSPNAPFDICFAQTKETMLDGDLGERFIKNAVSRFRKSRTYKNYKSHLMQMGLNRCQVHGNIMNTEDLEMATIEMHHNILTIYDDAAIITTHMINTQGAITTFDLVELLKMEHINHHIPTVMLSKTAHQMLHAHEDFIIPPDMVFGDWPTFLKIYKYGITPEIATKVLKYIDKVTGTYKDISKNKTLELLSIRGFIQDWSVLNDQQRIS